jgi:hypothetical protein
MAEGTMLGNMLKRKAAEAFNFITAPSAEDKNVDVEEERVDAMVETVPGGDMRKDVLESRHHRIKRKGKAALEYITSHPNEDDSAEMKAAQMDLAAEKAYDAANIRYDVSVFLLF